MGSALAAPSSTIECQLRDSSLLYTLRVKSTCTYILYVWLVIYAQGRGGWSRNQRSHWRKLLTLTFLFFSIVLLTICEMWFCFALGGGVGLASGLISRHVILEDNCFHKCLHFEFEHFTLKLLSRSAPWILPQAWSIILLGLLPFWL